MAKAKSGKKSKSHKSSKMKSPVKRAERRSKSAPDTVLGQIRGGVEKLTQQLGAVFTSTPSDITEAIKADHKALRGFLGLLKDTDKDMAERRRAYDGFSSLLKSHSLAEEKAVYEIAARLPGHEMHIKIAEGYVEHSLADNLMAQLSGSKDSLTWSAHANVLSETIEHHLKEEERDLLPLLRKAVSAKANAEMLSKFISLRKKSQDYVIEKNSGALGGPLA